MNSDHTERFETLPAERRSALHYIQLLQARAPLVFSGCSENFRRKLERVRTWYGLGVLGYVVMPEHVHLLVSEPEYRSFALAIQMLKQLTSQRLRHPGSNRPFWYTRYYDFNLRTSKKRIEKLRYMHRNPMARGLVEKPEDWEWSSFRHYQTGVEGVVEIESEWTALRRERAGIRFTVRVHNDAPTLSPKEGEQDGVPEGDEDGIREL